MRVKLYIIIVIIPFLLVSCQNREIREVERLINAHNYSVALNKVNLLLLKEKDKEYPRVLYFKGFLEDQIGNIDTAATYYILYLGFRNNDSRAINNLGNIFNEKGKYLDALSCFQNAIKLAPKDKVPRVNKAKVEFNLERYYDSYQTLRHAINLGFVLDMEDSLFYGTSLYFLDSLERAEAIYKKISLENFTPDTFEDYFITSLKLGNEEEAKNILLKALSKYPNNPVVLNMASHFYAEVKLDIPKAKEYCNASIELNPNYENLAYQNLGIVYQTLNQRDSCCMLVEKLALNNIKIYPELQRYCANTIND